MASRAYNVVLLPDSSIANKAAALSKELHIHGVRFTLEDGLFYPHVSIYMLQLETSILGKVEEALKRIAVNTKMFNLIALRYWQAMQFLDVEYSKPDALSSLQFDVVNALNPLRDGMREKDAERMKVSEGDKLYNFMTYGWDSIGTLYRPHLTITRFDEDQELRALQLPDFHDFTGLFDKVGLYEMGDNGTCVRRVMEFSLCEF